MSNYDVIIIGGGAGGISAACWCDELGLKALLLESEPELGGQLLRTHNPVKNHLGVEAENGRELRDRFVSQAANYNFSLRTGAEVLNTDLQNKIVTLQTGEAFSARALIIATGIRRRKLDVAGESELKGKGILESGKRDAEKVEGKNVCIVGGGDAALENALILAETARKVTLVHRRKDFRARAEFLEKARRNPSIEILTEAAVTKIIGHEKVEAVEIKNADRTFVLPVEAVLIRAGVEANTALFRGKLKLDKNGYIEIDSRCETSVDKVFAVGDVANPLAPTVSSAVGMGATAAKVILDKLSV
ncbi:MAG: NAD(P)/FAD-dependent oxidoreductase [Acidobacteriota bacterium]|nr:NAD(P)/FAD-dependent oxidoreductase [Acidobacteriota bacterium]